MYYTVQDYVRICDDIYYPEVEFYYPDVKKDSIDNIPNEKGYYNIDLYLNNNIKKIDFYKKSMDG